MLSDVGSSRVDSTRRNATDAAVAREIVSEVVVLYSRAARLYSTGGFTCTSQIVGQRLRFRILNVPMRALSLTLALLALFLASPLSLFPAAWLSEIRANFPGESDALRQGCRDKLRNGERSPYDELNCPSLRLVFARYYRVFPCHLREQARAQERDKRGGVFK